MKILSTVCKNSGSFQPSCLGLLPPLQLSWCHFSIVKPEASQPERTGSREQKSMPRVTVIISNKLRKQTGKTQSPVRLGCSLIRVSGKPARNVQRETGNEGIIKVLDKLSLYIPDQPGCLYPLQEAQKSPLESKS